MRRMRRKKHSMIIFWHKTLHVNISRLTSLKGNFTNLTHTTGQHFKSVSPITAVRLPCDGRLDLQDQVDILRNNRPLWSRFRCDWQRDKRLFACKQWWRLLKRLAQTLLASELKRILFNSKKSKDRHGRLSYMEKTGSFSHDLTLARVWFNN